MRAFRAGAGAVLIALAGCGGGSSSAPKPRSDADVVSAWAKAVRSGDYKTAAALFALPSLVQNGPTVHIRSRADADDFNRSLPCGAVLTGTAPAGKNGLLATFRLVRGPGGPCKGKAQVRFRIEKGRITQWVRTSSGPPPGSVET